jgi:hypothetical protein
MSLPCGDMGGRSSGTAEDKEDREIRTWRGAHFEWGLIKFFRSGRTTSLLKELVKLTPIPKWQTRMLLRYGDIDF